MKRHPAIAALEFGDIATGLVATDAMLKRPPIGFLKCGTISRGRFLALLGGTTASVEEACHEGLLQGGDSVLDYVLLADVHAQVFDAILGHRRPIGAGSLAIIETATVSSNIHAAELAVKGTPVDIIELRLADAGLWGKGLSIYHGKLHDIEAAVELVAGVLQRAGVEAGFKIIPAPHEALADQIGASTCFGSAALLELDGEEGER